MQMQIQIETNPGDTAVSEVSTMRIINMMMMTVMMKMMMMMMMTMMLTMMMMMMTAIAITTHYDTISRLLLASPQPQALVC